MLKKLGVLLGILWGAPKTAANRRSRFVPGVESLEDRAVPATFKVTTLLDVVNPTDGKLSLREAINRANANPGTDAIILPAGVYRLALTGADNTNVAGDLDVNGSTLFQGAGAGNTIIDGQHLDRVFDVLGTDPHSINVTFQGLTVRNGLSDGGGGGGIRVGNADLVLQDCAVSGNRTAGDGGGISNAARPGTGNVTLVHSTVNRNVAALVGGGVSVKADGVGQGSVLTVNGSTIRQNRASVGGGIFAGVATLNGSTVSGNSANRNGGGIFAENSVTLTGSTVSGNIAKNGGGIDAGTATLTSSKVSGNHASSDGGGIFTTTMATLTNSTVSGNYAVGDGGGIDGTTMKVTNSTVSNNHADFGGGIFATTAMLVRSTVSGNFASADGGGVDSDTANLTNSTVSGNFAGNDGGGINVGDLTLLNVTVTDNSAHDAGGVFLRNGGTGNVRNTIIAGNLIDFDGAGPDVFGVFTSGGHNLIGDGSGSTGFTNGVNGDQVGTAVNPIDPRLAPLANNGGPTQTHALRPGSPAIDHGDNTDASATDQRGVSRPRDGDGNGSRLVDIGAFER